MTWSDLAPTWPQGFDYWEVVLLLAAVAILKVDRGRILYKNSQYIDRLGWSIIAWDFLLGAYAGCAVLWAFYPATHNIWWQRVLVSFVIVVAAFQWFEVRKADRERVTRFMGQSAAVDTPGYRGPDRRVGPPDRRSTADIYHRERVES